MTIPSNKVKALCSDSETALVRASRKGELENLSPASLRQHSVRARKLADKWRDMERGQSRTRSRQSGDTAAENTKLKA
ncbi:MAG TPA: hypothetical protein PLR25_27790 [Planctomycetaceae bacterium]|nr:hypothetical protein [Planctomycetaceae bacterium]